MNRWILTTIAILSYALGSPVAADEIGAPDPDPGGDRAVLTQVGGGLLGAALGVAMGGLLGSSLADDGHDDFLDFDELAGGIAGAAILEPFALAAGVQAASGEDGSYGRALLGTLAATTLVYGTAAIADEGAVLAALIPLPLAGAVWVQNSRIPKDQEPAPTVRLSPWVEPERQGFVLSGTF